MINERFIRIVRDKKENILNLWLDDFKETRTLRTEEGVDESKLRSMMTEVLEGFEKVMEKDISKYRLCLDFTRVGNEFFKDNYAIHDIINALSILKKVIIEVVTTEGFFSTAFELYKLQEMNNKALLYFDRATYYSTLGYEDSLKGLMADKGDMGKLKKVFGSTEGRMKYIHSCAVEAEK